jgi:CubicO group peptidase (beta-lactamase class C family)
MNKLPGMAFLIFLSAFLLSYFENKPPVIQMDTQFETIIDSAFSIPVAVIDPDGDEIQINTKGLPTWLAFNPQEQALQGIPDQAAKGNHKILLIADDGTNESRKEIEVEVKRSLQKELEFHLDSLYRAITPGLVGVSVAVVDPEGQLVKTTIGKRNRWSNNLATTDLQYRVASITKTFTATLAMKLVEEGLLKLNDPISKYIDASRIPNGSKMTIFHLLSHTSGMVDHLNRRDFYTGNWKYKKWSHKDMLSYAARHRSLFSPGKGYAYSNTAYHIMGEILEQVTRESLSEAYKNWIFEPLGLENTFYDDFSSPTHLIKRLAQNSRSYEYDLSAAGAAGAIVSTPTDIVKFGKALYNGTFLSEASVKAMTTDYGTAVGGDEIGLGTRMWEDFGIYHYGHTGSLMDYRSVLIFVPDKKICLAIFTNQVHRKWYDLVNNLMKALYQYH